MKKIFISLTFFIFLTSCETLSSIKKPDLNNPFGKCPPKDERTVKNILCRE